MKLLVVLFAAAVLTSEISAYAYRGDDGVESLLPIPGRCKPGSCVVENGAICQCHPSGQVICPLSNTPQSLLITSYCTCMPGEILSTRTPCLCPKIGLMPIMGCGKGFPLLDEGEGPQSVKRQSDGGDIGSSRDSAPRRCDYYQCWPTQNGQQCIWIPCSNGR